MTFKPRLISPTGTLFAMVVRSIALIGVAAVAIGVVTFAADAPAASGSDYQLESAKVHEHTIDFMVTAGLGLFAVFGFFLKDGLSSQPDRRCAQVLVGAAFIVCASASFVLAYFGRTDLAHQLSGGTFLPEKLHEYYAWQARTLLIGALFLVLFVGLAVYPRRT